MPFHILLVFKIIEIAEILGIIFTLNFNENFFIVQKRYF